MRWPWQRREQPPEPPPECNMPNCADDEEVSKDIQDAKETREWVKREVARLDMIRSAIRVTIRDNLWP